MRPVSDIAIDLGTATTQVFVRGSGVVFDDLTLVACERRSGKVLDIGRGACDVVARSPRDLELRAPLRSGAIDDADLANQYVDHVLDPLGGGRMNKLDLLVTVPSCASPIERRVAREAGKRAGASSVRLIEHPVAVALGGDLGVHEPAGTFVVDLGAGVIEAALMSLGSVVAGSSARSGSAEVDLSIKGFLRREYGIVVSDIVAEQIKFTAAEVTDGDDSMIEAKGVTSVEGSTATAILEVSELHGVLDGYVETVFDVVRNCLSQAQPELAHDVLVRGMHLAGGPASSPQLAKRLSAEFALPVHVVAEPRLAGAIGAGKCLEAMESLDNLFLAER